MNTGSLSASGAARRALVSAIDHGVFGPGARLPGERGLAAQLAVSREALRRALRQLADQGVLQPSPQRGWYVTAKMISEPASELRSFTDMARARGLTATAKVLRSTERSATLEEADRLSVAPASPVLELLRLRSLDNIPVSLDHTTIALTRAPGLAEIDLTDASLYGTLDEVCGVQIVRSSYAVHADAADQSTGDLLRLDPGAPVLVGEEVAYDLADAPILWGRLVYRGDAYRFEATLYRPARRSVPDC